MPRLSRYFIKTGLLYFVFGLAMGTLVLAQPVMQWSTSLLAFRPVYIHLLMVGWVTQIIIGVAYWMFPKQSKEQPRGSEFLGWIVYILLNAGLLLRTIGEPLLVIRPAWNAEWTLGVSAALQFLAGWGFVLNTWRRVKER